MNEQKKTTGNHRQKSASAVRQNSTDECQQTSTNVARQKATAHDRQKSTNEREQNSTIASRPKTTGPSTENRRRLRLILSILLVLAAFWLGRQDFLKTFFLPANETQETKVVELGSGVELRSGAEPGSGDAVEQGTKEVAEHGAKEVAEPGTNEGVEQAGKEVVEQRQAFSDKPGAEKPVGQDSVVQDTAIQKLTAKDPAARGSVNQEATVQEPAGQKSTVQEQAKEDSAARGPVNRGLAAEKPAGQKTIVQEPSVQKTSVQKQAKEVSAAQELEDPRSPEFVASVLRKTGKLPDRFLSKKEARKLGWVPEQGNLNEVAPGKSIGGDHFGNYEGKLPEKKGRSYREADVHDSPNKRGAERLVFSNDGLIFYTPDHYKTFYDVSESFPGKKLP